MEIARIDRASGLVVNIELATQEWLDENATDEVFEFRAYTADEGVSVGSIWDGKKYVAPQNVFDAIIGAGNAAPTP